MAPSPDASTRPPLYGPDPHSFHGMSTDRDKTALKYMVDWLDACARLGVPIVDYVVGATEKDRMVARLNPEGLQRSFSMMSVPLIPCQFCRVD